MRNIILASQSPRRKQLLEQAGISFTIVNPDVDETVTPGMLAEEVPSGLAHKKAQVVAAQHPDAVIIAADTVVLLGNDLLGDEILGKPVDSEDAIAMLERLSGRMHRVVTGVCISVDGHSHVFSSSTEVYFRQLTLPQIQKYIMDYKPFDKAGSYAIQEWIGLIGIEKIHGDYYNVMGLPVGELYRHLTRLGIL
ncbi:MAG: Maf family protein [Chitinophagaceae bacterium]